GRTTGPWTTPCRRVERLAHRDSRSQPRPRAGALRATAPADQDGPARRPLAGPAAGGWPSARSPSPFEQLALGSAQEDDSDQGIEQDEEVVLHEPEGGHLPFVLRKEDDPKRDGGRAHGRGHRGREEDDRQIP